MGPETCRFDICKGAITLPDVRFCSESPGKPEQWRNKVTADVIGRGMATVEARLSCCFSAQLQPDSHATSLVESTEMETQDDKEVNENCWKSRNLGAMVRSSFSWRQAKFVQVSRGICQCIEAYGDVLDP